VVEDQLVCLGLYPRSTVEDGPPRKRGRNMERKSMNQVIP
jgi:hypothetical protein